MAIERKVEEKWVCDNCSKEIANKIDVIMLEIFVRRLGMAGLSRCVRVFCNKECANKWWEKFDKKKDFPLIE